MNKCEAVNSHNRSWVTRGKFFVLGRIDENAIIGQTTTNLIIGNFCDKNTPKSSLNNS